MSELRDIRKNIGITQEEAAKMVGVSRRTYQTYEEEKYINDAYKAILKALKEIDTGMTFNFVLNAKVIKKRCEGVFAKHPEVKCAYLYGSYARGEATEESDVDILVVESGMGLSFFGMASELKEVLGKEVDLQTHRQVAGDEFFLEQLLKDGIKIYG